ncbi:HlyD family secretion protein [Roseibium alexandrii]|uniref:Multidrug resistance efflux pump n=1 Tax=Roseibium alexandrii (strain DSM 17067 / NCIMB 14079 / DFL-11) TaxID=244592 RepID=A0A5E8H4M5_ROSAD|nr:efflux RND transporter periplasmic adaptor subunit [Roseibium alexandrii]EEE46911.1 Multidrug resistance efflux pump [Roseibium alexandrii DFL-11]
MIVFLTLCYCAVLFGLIKAGVIRLTPFWKASPVLWLVLLLVVLFIPMQWGAPSGPIRSYTSVIEIVPNVSGQVTDVPVQPLMLVEEGTVLFKIDPEPFEAAVSRSRAALAEAKQAVPQLEASFGAAEASVSEAVANRDRAKDEFDRLRTANENATALGRQSTPFSESDVEQLRLTYLASEASLTRAEATAEQARLAFTSEIDGQNTTVARLEADLRRAEFDLRETVVRAPADGYVLALTLRPGQRVSNLPLRSWMAFAPVATGRVVASIPQTRVRFIEPNQPAEVTFAYLPGKVFAAQVESLVRITAAGQLPPNGILPSLSPHHGPNETMGVVLKIDDSGGGFAEMPGGIGGTAAIYTQTAGATHLIRKVMIRMDAWLNYVRPN